MSELEKSRPEKGGHGGRRAGAGRRRWEPSAADRAVIKALAGCGASQEFIARRFGVRAATLRRVARRELDDGMAEASVQVAMTLFKKAVSGDLGAIIWYEKTRVFGQYTRDGRSRTPGRDDVLTLDIRV